MTTSKEESSLTRERGAIRCARATMLLYSLASSRRDLIDSGDEQKEGETRREIEDLKKKLAKEKNRTNRIKLCGFMEMLLLVLLLLLISTFLLVFFLPSI